MENASNALIIAASVLIGILILTLGVSLYMSLGEYVSNTRKELDDKAIVQFNDQFMIYDGKTDLTIQDVITVRNIALRENNSFTNYNVETTESSEYNQNNRYVDVLLGGKRILDEKKYPINTILQDALDSNKFDNIKCRVTISTVTGRVYKLEFYY